MNPELGVGGNLSKYLILQELYWLQLNILGKHGVDIGTPANPGTMNVVITETGYELGNDVYGFEGYPPINDWTLAKITTREGIRGSMIGFGQHSATRDELSVVPLASAYR